MGRGTSPEIVITNRPFSIGRRLGEGAQSQVYLAHDTECDAPLALKVLAPEADRALGRTLMRREYYAMVGIDHPGVVAVHDFGETQDGRPYFTMELVEGSPFTEAVEGWSEESVLEILELVLDALGHIHRRGVIHGDLKPTNILVRSASDGPRVKLLDFGLAAIADAPELAQGLIRGSIHYLAPEAIRGGEADARSDLYSLGATLFQALTGHPLWEGDPPATVLRKHLEVEAPLLRSLRRDASPELETFVARLLQKDPRLRFAGASEARRAVAVLLGRNPEEEASSGFSEPRAGSFVGREECIDQVLGLVRDCVTSGGRVLVMEGPAGSGKTRLLAELRVRAGLSDTLPLLVGPRPGPYGTWREVAALLRERVEQPGEPADLGGFFSSDEPPGGDDDLDPSGRKNRLFEATCRAIARLLTDHPPVLVLLDDLQDCDAGTRDFLRFLSRQIESLPLVVVAAVATPRDTREEDPESSLHHLLEPLTQAQVGQLTATLLGVEDLPERLTQHIYEESGGNPADVEDHVHALADQNLVQRDSNGQLVVDEASLARLPTPRRMADWLKAQVSQASAEGRMALSVASLLPQPFDPDLLTGALGMPEELTFDLLSQLESAGLVRCRQGRYQIAGARLRRHLSDNLAQSSRQDLLDRIARCLEDRRKESGPERVPDDLLADYMSWSKEPRRAIPYLMAAADAAAEDVALHDAIGHLRQLLSLLEDLREPQDEELVDRAREKLADLLNEVGDVNEAVEIYDDLMVRARKAKPGEPPRLSRLGFKLAKLYQRRGDYERSHEELREVLKHLDRDRDAPVISDVFARIAGIFKARGIYPESFKYGSRSLKVAIEADDRGRIANALNYLGLIHFNKGDLTQAQHFHQRALLALAGAPHDDDTATIDEEILYRASTDPFRARVVVNNLGNVHWKRGEWDRATEYYETALRYAERVGDLSGIASASNNLALINFGRGDWESAIEGFRRSLDTKSKLGERAGVAIALSNLAAVHERIGRWTESRDLYLKGLDLHQQLGEKKGVGLGLCALGNLYRKMGDHERAERETEAGFELLSECGDADALAHGFYCRAMLCKDREDFVTALRHANEALRLLEKDGNLESAGSIYSSMADLLVRMGDLDRAREMADRSISLAQSLGDPYEEGKTLSVVGRILYQRRDRASARAAFEQGIETLEKLGARFELGRSIYEYGLRLDDPARAARQIEKSVGIFRSIGAKMDLERALGTLDRIRENLHGFDAPEARSATKVVGLYEIGKLINSMLDLDEVLERVMDLVLERTRADRGLILLLDEDGSFQVRAARNIERETLRRTSEISASVVHEVVRSQGPVMSGNAAQDERFSSQQSIIQYGIVSVAAVPLRIKDRIAGAIYLDHLKDPDYFTDKDLEFLQAFADQAAVAIENARLYRELQEASDRLAAENRVLRDESRRRQGDDLVGRSTALREVQTLLQKAASTGETTLLLGESGVGKSFLARTIHDWSPRREGPFVKFNCAALPETLMESELFGHERGAFTGADRRKLGRFEIANQGTIFLDEIGNISPSVQAKLLRILEDKEFERVGGTRTIRTAVHIITATNRDLEQAIRDGGFREDLYYRLNIFPIRIPPLRERREDIPLLAEQFLARLRSELDLDRRGFSDEALDILMGYDWPGNVRELQSAVRRAAVLAESDTVGARDLRFLSPSDDIEVRVAAPSGRNRESLIEEAVGSFVDAPRKGEKIYQAVTENVERVLIRRVLEECDGQIRVAARQLGIARNTLRAKMKRYGLTSSD